jgi:Heavy metal binding domain
MISPNAELALDSASRARPRAWRLVLIARVALFALAAAGSAFALLSSGREARDTTVRYRCPMHPDAVSSEPAACPICGMALVRENARHSVTAGHAGDAPDARVARAARRRFAEQVRAPAWIEANGEMIAMLYRDDLVDLAPDQPAQFFAATTPSIGVDVTLVAEPPVDWDGATVRARFQVAGGDARPGTQGSLVIAARPRALVVVPSNAILSAPDGPYVFVVDPASHRDVRRTVRIGRAHQGVTAVLAGVSEGDEVVVGDAFFVAAEHRLHPEEAP